MNTILSSNLSGIARVTRVIVGFTLMSSVMFYSHEVPVWVSLIAVYPVITAMMAWDPLYAVLSKVQLLVGPLENNRKMPLVR